MKRNNSSPARAFNDVVKCEPDEQMFVQRLYDYVFYGVFNLKKYMSKTMKKRVCDIANSVTTIVIYRLYAVNGHKNEQQAQSYINQFKCIRVLCDRLCEYITIHDLCDEILNKVENTGKPLFNFINKNF